jgi:hypothetical protein
MVVLTKIIRGSHKTVHLTKITRGSHKTYHRSQGPDRITRSSWNAQCDKDGRGGIVGFHKKLIRWQPITEYFKVE